MRWVNAEAERRLVSCEPAGFAQRFRKAWTVIQRSSGSSFGPGRVVAMLVAFAVPWVMRCLLAALSLGCVKTTLLKAACNPLLHTSMFPPDWESYGYRYGVGMRHVISDIRT